MLLEIMDGHKTQEGYFKGRAIVTGVAVLDYTKIFGVHMLRPEDEVFRDETMGSARGIPLTLRHPPANLTSETAIAHTIGMTGDNVERIGNQMAINFTIIEGWVIDRIFEMLDAGQKVRFSLGYWAFPDRTEGVFNGQSFQIIQRNILYNHLALLLDGEGRYPYTELITDSKSDKMLLLLDGQLMELPKTRPQEVIPVKIVLPNGKSIEVTDAQEATDLQHHLTEHASLKNQLGETKGALKAAQKQLQDAKGQIMDSTRINEVVSERLTLALEAQSYLDSVEVEDLAEMSESEIYDSVLEANGYTQEELKDEDEATKRGMYKQLIKAAGESTSEAILDSAHKKSKSRPGRQQMFVPDALEEAQKKLRERTEARRVGQGVRVQKG